MKQGPVHALVQSLADMGSGGEFTGNLQRDFERHVRRHGAEVDIRLWAHNINFQDGLGVQQRKVYCLLPHDVLSFLWRKERSVFSDIFEGPPGSLSDFWAAAEGQPWFNANPLRPQIVKDPCCVLPLRLHGDDAPLWKTVCGLCLSFSSPLAWCDTAQRSIFPVFYLPMVRLEPGAEQDLYSIVVWSLNCLMTGRFPDRDWRGKLFSHRYMPERFRVANHMIASGLRFTVSEILGDLKFLKEALLLPVSYQHRELCMFCYACKTANALCFSDFREGAGHRARKRSHAEFMGL